MLERGIVNSIEKYLRKGFPGCYLLKLESPSTSGILDLYFAYKVRSIWFEVKRPHLRGKTWKNKKIQEWHQRELRRNGIEADFVFSLSDVKSIMAKAYITRFYEEEYQPKFKPMKIDYISFKTGLQIEPS